MVQLTTFPSMEVLQRHADSVPEYMHPNTIPFAVILEGYLLPGECEHISNTLNEFDTYKASKCGAISRECGNPLVMEPVNHLAHQMNRLFWGFDVDVEPMTWMQTYHEGGGYQLHMDTAPGRSRKLTAVTMLTDPDNYQGGELTLHYHPQKISVPKTQGTIVVFQSSLLHEVSLLTDGQRQTTNTSFWGPPFR